MGDARFTYIETKTFRTQTVGSVHPLLEQTTKQRVRAVVIETVQSVVIETQQRSDTEKIWEAYDRGLHIENLAQDLVVVWTTLAWPRTA